MRSFERPLVLILGGRNKGLCFDELATVLSEKAAAGGLRGCILMGEAGSEIGGSLTECGLRPFCKLVSDMRAAVEAAITIARSGDVVLLSPGCASFDAYTGYAERGRDFSETVKRFLEAVDG